MTRDAPAELVGREIIVEAVVQGAYLRVAAIDVATGTEAHAVGPDHASEAYLEQLALGKLARALRSDEEGGPEGRSSDAAEFGDASSRGRWV